MKNTTKGTKRRDKTHVRNVPRSLMALLLAMMMVFSNLSLAYAAEGEVEETTNLETIVSEINEPQEKAEATSETQDEADDDETDTDDADVITPNDDSSDNEITTFAEVRSDTLQEITYYVAWYDTATNSQIENMDADPRSATVGTEVSVTDADKVVNGYTYAGDNYEGTCLKATLEAGVTTTLKLYFTKNPEPDALQEIIYYVAWYDTDTGSHIEGIDVVERSATVGTEVSVIGSDKEVEGYTYAGDDYEYNCLTATLVEGETTTLKLYFTKVSTNIAEPYTSRNTNTFDVSNFDEFIDAIATINSSETGNYTISLTADIGIEKQKSDGTKITSDDLVFEKSNVTLLGNGQSITYNAGGSNVIQVDSNATLNLGNGSNNLTIKGNGKTTHQFASIYIDGGTVNMYSGVSIQDYEVYNAGDRGAGVTVQGNGIFNMHGGTISNCKLSSAQQYGGAVAVVYGTFNMNGGTITGNVVKDYWKYDTFGGGVFVGGYAGKPATFEMSGGTISNNTATFGGGVAIFMSTGTFNMTGGEIIGNNAVNTRDTKVNGSGGGVYVLYGVVNQTGGAIYNNDATYVGDDVYAEGVNASNLKLSTITGKYDLSSCPDDDCKLTIDGWYLDDEDARWGTTREEYDYQNSYFTKFDKTNNIYDSQWDPNYTEKINSVGIKAAHGDPPVETTYNVEWYDADTGSLMKTDLRKANVGDTVKVDADDKKVDGYIYAGDNYEDTCLEATLEADVTATLKLYFTKKTTYNVEWYDADGNTIKLTETRDANVGTEVSVTDDDKEVTGYTFDEDNSENVLNATVASEGTTLKLYFTKNPEEPKEANYTVKWYEVAEETVNARARSITTVEVKVIKTEVRRDKIGTEVSVTDDDKVVEGYTFNSADGRNVLTATVAADGSTTLELYFTKNSTGPVNPDPVETTYKVEWYGPDGKTMIKTTETRNAKVGAKVSVTEADKVVEGYTFDATNKGNILTATVAADGSTTLKLYFTKNSTGPVNPDPKVTSYKVKWYDTDGNTIKKTETRYAEVGTKVSVTEADKVVEGYTFDATNKGNILTATVAADGSTTLKLFFTKNSTGPVNPDPKETSYKVKWYDTDGNTIKKTDTRYAEVGAKVSVTEADKVVEGYTFDATNKGNILTATVAADGSTTLKLFFTKNTTEPVGPDNPESKETSYKVKWYDTDGNTIKKTEKRYAEVGTKVSVTEADKVVEGYIFDATNKGNILTATVAADGSTVLKLFFKKDTTKPEEPENPEDPKQVTYTVEWFDLDGKTIKNPETRTATVGAKVSVTDADKLVTGYTFDADNKGNVLTAIVAEDGSTVLKLFFKKDTTKTENPEEPENTTPTTPTQPENTTPNTPDRDVPKTGDKPNYALYLMLASGLALVVLVLKKRKDDKDEK